MSEFSKDTANQKITKLEGLSKSIDRAVRIFAKIDLKVKDHLWLVINEMFNEMNTPINQKFSIRYIVQFFCITQNACASLSDNYRVTVDKYKAKTKIDEYNEHFLLEDTSKSEKKKLVSLRKAMTSISLHLDSMDMSAKVALKEFIYVDEGFRDICSRKKDDFSYISEFLIVCEQNVRRLIAQVRPYHNAPYRDKSKQRVDLLFTTLLQKWQQQNLPLGGGTDSPFILFCHDVFNILDLKKSNPRGYYDKYINLEN